MKRQSNDADRRLAVASTGCGHSGLLLNEGCSVVGGKKDVSWGSRLLLEKRASGVFNGYAKCVKVIEVIAIGWTTKANS
jgi:hypothetical protein